MIIPLWQLFQDYVPDDILDVKRKFLLLISIVGLRMPKDGGVRG